MIKIKKYETRSANVLERLSIANSIFKIVCQYYGVTTKNARTSKRKGDLVLARQIAMYLMNQRLDKIPLTVMEIGLVCGYKHHSTVIRARNTIHEQIKTSANIRFDVDRIEQLVDKYLNIQWNLLLKIL